MVEIRQAIDLAKRHVADVFAADGVRDVLLEGVEADPARNIWNITVSFLRFESQPKSRLNLDAALKQLSERETRTFKQVQLDKESGELLKISDIAGSIAAE